MPTNNQAVQFISYAAEMMLNLEISQTDYFFFLGNATKRVPAPSPPSPRNALCYSQSLRRVSLRVATWQTRASRAEGLLETVEQPTRYMLDSIRSKDVEIDSLRSAHHTLLAKMKALEGACRCARRVVSS